MELGNIKLTWTEIGTLYSKRLFLCDQIVKFMTFGKTDNYDQSYVRKWLNSDFLDLISEKEKAKIEPFPLTEKYDYVCIAGDKFFLLSKEEYKDFKSNIRDAGAPWWLRTQGHYVNYVSYVEVSGGYVDRTHRLNPNVGVRPAFLMD